MGNSIAAIRQFYDLGVRYITTTHNCDNAFATSASTVAIGGEDRGLTPFGHEYVKEMNRLGMMIDLSHVSHQTMRDVLSITRAPIIFSHSGAYSVQRHLRHVPDDVLRGVRKNGGIVMMTFINRFLNMENPDSANINDVVDHIFYIAEVAGWEHVGVGGDYSGTPDCPRGLEVRLDLVYWVIRLILIRMTFRMYLNIPTSLLPCWNEERPTSKFDCSLVRIYYVYGLKSKGSEKRFVPKGLGNRSPMKQCGMDGHGPKVISGFPLCSRIRRRGYMAMRRERGLKPAISTSNRSYYVWDI